MIAALTVLLPAHAGQPVEATAVAVQPKPSEPKELTAFALYQARLTAGP